jgi:hypothetical protein
MAGIGNVFSDKKPAKGTTEVPNSPTVYEPPIQGGPVEEPATDGQEPSKPLSNDADTATFTVSRSVERASIHLEGVINSVKIRKATNYRTVLEFHEDTEERLVGEIAEFVNGKIPGLRADVSDYNKHEVTLDYRRIGSLTVSGSLHNAASFDILVVDYQVATDKGYGLLPKYIKLQEELAPHRVSDGCDTACERRR